MGGIFIWYLSLEFLPVPTSQQAERLWKILMKCSLSSVVSQLNSLQSPQGPLFRALGFRVEGLPSEQALISFFSFLGLGFPRTPLKAKKGTLFVPSLLLGLVFEP